MLFTDFSFDDLLQKGIREQGYTHATPIQAQTIPLLLSQHDVIGCAQTGTGKTAAFALPILQGIRDRGRQPQALIVAPTRELAEQIENNIKGYARYLPIRCLAVYGGVKAGPQEIALRKGVEIVVATPGRLLDHLRQRVFSLASIRYLVLDEADRMLDMGFLPDIRRIVSQLPAERQTLLFSATMPREIEALARTITRDAKQVMVAPRNTTATRINQQLYKVEKPLKIRLLIHLLRNPQLESVIVFSRTRHGADRITKHLKQWAGIQAACIHADRSQSQRQNALKGFKSGDYRVLVATDIAARGIDIEAVSHVINYDTPVQAEDYVHRIGRTGRADASGEAWTFSSSEEAKALSGVEKLIGRKIPLVAAETYAEAFAENPDVVAVPHAKAKIAATPQRKKTNAKPRSSSAPPKLSSQSRRPRRSASARKSSS